MPIYRFTCTLCQRLWEDDVTDPTNEACNSCNRYGVVTTVEFRAKRSDAVKRGKMFGANDSIASTRPVRTVTPVTRFGEAADEEDLSSDDDFDDDDLSEDEDEYLPSKEFNSSMRFSAGGSFTMMRGLPTGTTIKQMPWTRITAAAGRSSTNAQFAGQSASKHAAVHVPHYVGQATVTTYAWEWCHLLADSLGGPTTQNNLFCGTFHANTAMLCIERVLHAKTEYMVQVLVDLKAGTHVAERITYKVKHEPTSKKRKAGASSSVSFSCVIDGQATGCTAADGRALTGLVRKFMR